jgi:hypothetical protein
MGAQRREERQLERARRMEERRIWEMGKRDRALSARRSRSSSPACVHDVQTQRAVRHGMVEVYHRYFQRYLVHRRTPCLREGIVRHET